MIQIGCNYSKEFNRIIDRGNSKSGLGKASK
jgi:hypothetical protein